MTWKKEKKKDLNFLFAYHHDKLEFLVNFFLPSSGHESNWGEEQKTSTISCKTTSKLMSSVNIVSAYKTHLKNIKNNYVCCISSLEGEKDDQGPLKNTSK